MTEAQVKILEDLLLEEESEFRNGCHTNTRLPRRERSIQRKQDRIDALKAALKDQKVF